MKKGKVKVLAVIGIILLAAIYYYVTLPAINIHSSDFWMFFIVIVIIAALIYIRRKKLNRYELKNSKGVKVILGILVVVVAAYLIGTLLSSPIVNAKKYQKLLDVKDGEFTKDIEELSFEQIPLLDRDSAAILGNRKMGSMVDMVSQFEVDDLYSQINYQDQPVRVSPLRYASVIKWLTNQKEGIPAYIKIDMATQNTELVKLKEGMKYTTSDHFNRNIYRHLRFKYPTYIFNDLSFEIDDDGVPYWICPVKKFNIGLFGGTTIGRVVLCNAITGETKDYKIEDAPEWIDRAYSADLLVELYDYYGSLKHGYFNSILGQKDCLKTTTGYNYLAIDDDVWVYTGVTSVSGDQSNVGFVLMNQRTMETKFYGIEGATEDSAMSSAEGQVQNLKYKATFPLLLNISGEPTYFIALKDDAGLVKKYAMVNVQKYQIVAIGDTVSSCEAAYTNLMYENGIKEVEKDTREIETITAKITKIAQGVIDGNSHYYVMLEGSDEIFDVSVVDFIDIIKYEVGQEVTVEYKEGDTTNTVLSFNGEELQKTSPSSDGENADNGQQDDTAQAEEGTAQE
ncbi:CvpA family protein [Eubacterium sp. am_0171]|uniref:CvpA family protein n=1 Tax=unclassified Eubacterium (in: firmicutes) TaxID=2624479 RepID=UPI0010209B7A|nr:MULTISPECIES: CvpA family protein [unclassified Eubacterium (in: firmicutes)]MSC84841.1 CvpA family protein [Eubacterium sp. BIOML-A1]MSD07464.1 CvpA family protein [Eubacterium sp. BIOML-A2]RYT14939.1 CvpA family protein [Eubacterium sp. am_0171]